MADTEKNKIDKAVDKVKDKTLATAQGLAAGDRVLWHRIIMSVVIGFVGICVIFSVFASFLIDQQRELTYQEPVVKIHANAALPEGNYTIYKGMIDIQGYMRCLVSDVNGGVVVAVKVPKGADMPDDTFEYLNINPATYNLSVDKDGVWHFIPTPLYDEYKWQLEKIGKAETTEK